MNKFRFLFALFLLLSLSSCHRDNSEKLIRDAVDRQMETYPKSTLCDLYKNFFQDQFGPEHLIKDTTMAGNYLRKELSSFEEFDGALYEPTGYEGNFYRVNLSIIKLGLIDYETFFNAFIRSAKGIQPTPIEDWKIKWEKINVIIAEEYPDLENYAQDNAKIDSLLQSGHYVMHHSITFNKTYNFHYRIISKEIFEKDILPIIKNAQSNI